MLNSKFLNSYLFNWESFEIIIGGKSSLDAKNYLSHFKSKEKAEQFMKGYGFDIHNPVEAAEVFGIFQEALQFIRRFFLKEGNADGLDYQIPTVFYSITDIADLLMILDGKSTSLNFTKEDSIWAAIILKVMHTILHTDKDLRYNYFSSIQTQIFDRFYRFINRDEQGNLYLENKQQTVKIALHEFQTKAKKTRESIIIKLLHKRENVAEELFDRIGIRIITKNKIDCLRVIKFLQDNFVIIPNNIKPSRSHNSLLDLSYFKTKYKKLLKEQILNEQEESIFSKKLDDLVEESYQRLSVNYDNQHSLSSYRALHFTGRQLIKYRNPFLAKFNDVKRMAKKDPENSLSEMILNLDTTTLTRDIRFFYPFEVQITDYQSHLVNTEGEASHEEYKRSQLNTSMYRIFQPLIDFKSSQSH